MADETTRTERDSMGPIEVGADRYWGAQTQRSLHHFSVADDRMPDAVIRSMAVLKKAAAEVNRDLGKMPRRARGADRAGGRRDHRGQARRPLPALRLADRVRHTDEHERQRGHLQPGDRDRRWGAGEQDPDPSQRRRQHVAVVERHLPDRDEHRCGRGGDEPASALGAGTARHARAARRGLLGHRQDRPHAPAGRGPAHARSGVLRVRRPARSGHRADRSRDQGPLRARDRRHRGRYRPEHAPRVCRSRRREDRGDHRAALLIGRATSSRRSRPTTISSSRAARSARSR